MTLIHHGQKLFKITMNEDLGGGHFFLPCNVFFHGSFKEFAHGIIYKYDINHNNMNIMK